MADTALTQPYSPTRLAQEPGGAALLHLEQVSPLIPLLHPQPEELLSLLNQGQPIPLLPQASEEGLDRGILTPWDAPRLEQALDTLFQANREAALLQGWSGLCLAEGRLVSGSQVSAPLLLWPVSLEQDQGQWCLTRGSEGSLLNRAVLDLLPQPEEGWSLNRDPLARQLDHILASLPAWQRKEGLWLGRFPLWVCELPTALTRPLSPESAAQLLEQVPQTPPVLDVQDTTGEENLVAPLPLDGTQMTALNHLLQGESLLVSGGRGTGKTQLAVSLMVNGLGIGQRTLLVAPREGDRASALQHLARMGLSDLVLELPSQGDRKNAVLHQYNLAAQVQPKRSGSGYFSLSEQTNQLSRRLNRAAAALHTPGHCGLSPFQLICRYLEAGETADLLPLAQPMISHLDAQGLEHRLHCAQELVHTARALGSVSQHPLSFVWGCEYPESAMDSLPQTLAHFQTAVDALGEAGARWCRLSGLAAPQTQEDWDGLCQGAKLLQDWRRYPAAWATSSRISLLTEAIQEFHKHVQQLEQLQAQIQADWEDSVFALDSVKLEKQWQFLRDGWVLPTEAEREETLRQLLIQAEGLLGRLEQAGAVWSRCVGTPAPTTRDSWERSYEVAVELARWKEIPRAWGGCSSMQALLFDVGELIGHGKQAKECKDVLLRSWSPDFLLLDGKELSRRWQQGGRLGLGLLKRQSTLRGELEPYCTEKLTPNLLESSLRWLVDYQAELSQCNEIYRRWERELQPVYQQEETDWIWLEAARRVAAESHDWLTELTGSEDFLRKHGQNPEAIAAAESLQAQWELARDTLGRLDVIVGRTSQPDSRNWIQERHSDCRRLRNLLQVRQLLAQSAKGPLTLGAIGDALALFAQHQTEQTTVDTLYHRWEAELAGQYQGVDTDWDALELLSRQAAQSDEALAQCTGDLELRVRLAGDAQAQEAAHALCSCYQTVTVQAKQLSHLVSAHLWADGKPWLPQLRDNATLLETHLDQLETWMNWRRLCRQGDSLGLHSFVAHFDQPLDPQEDTWVLFRKSLYRAILQLELDWIPELKQFSSRQLGEVLRQYARLDHKLSQRTWEELLHVAASRLPDLVREPLLQEEVNLIRWANETDARDISLEGLIHGLPRMTRGFFPCVVASPTDALRCFGEAAPFDYILIDGAETLPAPVGRALLGLGKTALLLSGGRGISFPCFAQEDSLWAVCQPLPLARLRLSTCYLPRQESLHWLDRQTFHSASLPSSSPQTFAIRYQPVVGRLSGGTNPAEAAAVTARALALAEEGETSFAVAALTEPQARLIRSLLQQAALDNPDQAQVLECLPVYPIWALGSRLWDTLLCSLTLAPDPEEGLSGAQALIAAWDQVTPLQDLLASVARQLWLFCSLDRQDWPTLGRVQPQLADFLSYVQGAVCPEPVHPYPFTNAVQRSLCQALRNKGYLAEPAPAPLSLRVASPQSGQGYLLGILLDDQNYGALPRSRERELTRAELLQAQGWNSCRVWTMEWLMNPEHVLQLLSQMLERLLQPEEDTSPEAEEAPVPASPAGPALYAPAQLSVIAIRENEVGNPSFQNRIYRVVEQIILQEAPLSVPQLSHRMLTAFGLDAQDPELLAHCASLWRKLGLRITREDDLAFVWRTDQDPDQYRLYRISGPEPHNRLPEDVSCQESVNAALAVLDQERVMTPGNLARAAAQALGYDPEEESALRCGERGVAYGLLMGRLLDTPMGTVVENPEQH